ncbi:MAG: hypothetical protein KF878_37685, partial [Planctomycetes bacterium]|nr:hypothetical protein [Planctomycetota bacterium]
ERRHEVGALLLVPLPVVDEAARAARERAARAALARPLTLHLDESPLDEAASVLSGVALLEVRLTPTVEPDVRVTLRVSDVPASAALDLLVAQAGLAWTLEDGVVVVGHRDERHPAARRFPAHEDRLFAPVRPDRHPARLAPAALMAEVRAAVDHALGAADAWAGPATLALEGTTLVVRQTAAGHAAVERHLAGRQGGPLPSGLEGAWYGPGPARDPAFDRARAVWERLHARQVTLNFDGTSLADALSFFSDLGFPTRLEAETARRLAANGVTVSLRLNGIAAHSALALVLAADDDLVFDVDRDGVLVRHSDRPSPERLLATGAESALDPASAEVRRQLAARRASLRLRLEARPLAEALRALQAQTGLDLVLDPALERREHPPVTIVSPEASVGALLDALLGPLELGLRVEQGVVRVVERALATEAPVEAHARRLLALPLGGEARVGLPLGGLLERLEGATGAPVVALKPVRASRARLALPAGLTVEAALRLAARQTGLRHAWFVSGGQPALALTIDDEEVGLLEAAQALGWPSPSRVAPAPVVTEWEAVQARLSEALRALALAHPGELTDATELEAHLGRVERAHAGLKATRALVVDLLSDGLPDRDLPADDLVLRLCQAAREGRDTGELRRRLRGVAAARRVFAGEGLDQAFPRSAQGAREPAPVPALERGLDRLTALARAALGPDDAPVSVDGVAAAGWFDVALRLGAAGERALLRVRDPEGQERDLAWPLEDPASPPTAVEGTWQDQRRTRARLRAEGGSATTERAVDAALGWLARHQHSDGGWRAADWTRRCVYDAPCGGPGHDRGDPGYDVGLTALATLALLGQGRPGPHDAAVDRALAWLIARQDEGGAVGFDGRHGVTIYNHALATEALCEAVALGADPALRARAGQAVAFCLRAQNPGLGWKYGVRPGRNDTSVTGAMVRALVAARRAGLPVPPEAFDGALAWFARATDAQGETGYESPGGGSSFLPVDDGRYDPLPVMTAVALEGRLLLGDGQAARAPALERATGRLIMAPPVARDPRRRSYEYWRHGTAAAFQRGGEAWALWRPAVVDALLPLQRADGCDAGSFAATAEWCVVGGRVYATASAALTLQTFYRHPRGAVR